MGSNIDSKSLFELIKSDDTQAKEYAVAERRLKLMVHDACCYLNSAKLLALAVAPFAGVRRLTERLRSIRYSLRITAGTKDDHSSTLASTRSIDRTPFPALLFLPPAAVLVVVCSSLMCELKLSFAPAVS